MKQTRRYVDYFFESQKQKVDWKIGAEFEHFVVKSDLTSVTFNEENGIEKILHKLKEEFLWIPKYEESHLIGLEKSNVTITLEPAGQLEISIAPQRKIEKISMIYQNVIQELLKVISEFDYLIISSGYLPKSKISDIPLLPKKRYKFMYDYLAKRGNLAHNMMKGTASIQATIDYSDENDFVEKMRLAYQISPIIALLFDNSLTFEGENYQQNGLRQKIWRNCDNQRCGTISTLFVEDFGYEKYADYVLSVPPIFIEKEDGSLQKWEKQLSEIYKNSWTKAQFAHTLSMHFPDIRARNYIEIRTADALPYPMNISLVYFLQTIFYNNYAFTQMKQLFSKIKNDDINDAINSIIQKGFDAKLGEQTIDKYMQKMILIFENVNIGYELHNLEPVISLMKNRMSYKQFLQQHFSNNEEIYRAVSLNNLMRCRACANL